MTVTAKFYVSEVRPITYGVTPGRRPAPMAEPQAEVTLHAVTSGSEDNKQWNKWTPSGSLKMTVTNPAAIEQFQVGQYVMLTMEPVPFEG